MTTTDAPTTPAPITCRKCGRPLTNPVSRVLRIGDRCRHGVPEHELAAALTGASA